MLAPDLVLPALVARRAAETPDRVYLEDAGGRTLTYAQTDREAKRWAQAYREVGVSAGDTVLAMLPMSALALCSWLGLGRLRAIEVPVNTAYRNRMLAHVVADSAASVVVVAAKYLPQLAEIADQVPGLRTVVVTDAEAAGADRPTLPWEVLDARGLLPADPPAADPAEEAPSGRDTCAILYTSGTTGPPKGVQVAWAQLHATATGMPPYPQLTADDTYYCPYPLFHVGGKHPPYLMALAGGRVVVKDGFRTQEFWPDIRRHGCTVTFLLSAMSKFVESLPAAPDDADRPLRHVIMVPLLPELDAFRKRFDVEVSTIFNMTEISTPIRSDGADLVDGRSCGRLRPGYQAQVVDENDDPVPHGEVGELVVRGDVPWTHMSGYWRLPEKTAESFRNQWFHTGDAFTRDAEGNFYFVERMNDVIRRRGENIPSSEVEAEATTHPDIAECAVVGVPSRWGEHEIKAVVVPEPGRTPAPADLHAYLVERLPRFMVPRYVELVAELPLTATQKVSKSALRAAGITAQTWDSSPETER
ncbi:AMP-binding protein [Pseudonocardia kunmingensis]|uniref:Crotonobetaine/carnitine-CoA ligase n=1 Tax=Pseudonocardia kunmingensis TaxID=630975 RepID=A0A543DP09_9PSEU|nr:AMP-binding protein [Pseudonocardia kunmingensis]TQM11072.1 crotonobetaine/carnitine-CoA ligase [Pseudonocardia kunmingensis]